ncbi:MAG: hypothetical protein JSR87_01690 [Proteobacteria bacterium]|nr:hypothetical protein [Pseudomonadota bacterium]MBS0574680.1 hypothetical protein [Pseudomonadota bacterium]
MLAYMFVKNAESFALATPQVPFRCVLLVDCFVTRQTMRAICEGITDAGCRYAMTWGRNSEDWHDTFDLVVCEYAGAGEVPPNKHMITTWHDGESLGDVIVFAKRVATTSSQGVELANLIVIDLGEVERGALVKSLYEQA